MAVNVYKSIKLDDIRNRVVKTVSASDKVKIKQTVTNFITYLKAAHS